MKEKKLVSVIIPVYNVEKYLERCVNSILLQTYQKLEVILVDDGSTDASSNLCDTIANKDSRIKVFHLKNGGVSQARNFGMMRMQGEYCMFVDADDYINNDYVETLYNDITKYDADIVCGGCLEFWDEKNEGKFSTVKSNRLVNTKDELFVDLYNGNESYGYVVWAKLFKTAIIRNVIFDNLKYGEDTLFMLKIFSLNPKVYLNSYKGYYYMQRSDSATGMSKKRGAKKEIDRISVGAALLEYGKTDNVSMWEKYVERQASYVYDALSRLLILKDYKEYLEHRKLLKQSIFEVFLYKKHISKKYRYMLEMYYYFPRFYWCMKRVFHKIKFKGV